MDVAVMPYGLSRTSIVSLRRLEGKVQASSHLAHALIVDAKTRYSRGYVQSHLVMPLEIITAVAVNTLNGLGKILMHGCSMIAHLFYARAHVVQDMKAVAEEFSIDVKVLLAGVAAACISILYPKIHNVFSESNERCKSPQELALEENLKAQKSASEAAVKALTENLNKAEKDKTALEESHAVEIAGMQSKQIELEKAHTQKIHEMEETLKEKKEELEGNWKALDKKLQYQNDVLNRIAQHSGSSSPTLGMTSPSGHPSDGGSDND